MQQTSLARHLGSEPGLLVGEEREDRSCRAGRRHWGKTVDTVLQKHPLTKYSDKNCSCSPIFHSLLPKNLAPYVCSAQLADRVDQLGISLGRYRRRKPARKRPYCGGRRKQGRTIPVIVSDRSRPRYFALSALRLMTLPNPSQIGAIQHLWYYFLKPDQNKYWSIYTRISKAF